MHLQDNFKLSICEYEKLRLERSTDNVLLPFFVLRVERTETVKKNVNLDSYQSLLKAIAERVSDFLHEDNCLVILNDVEFVITLPPKEKRPEVIAIATSIIQLFDRSFPVENDEYFLQPRLGISLYGRDGYGINELIQKSRNALETITNVSNTKYRFYSLTFSLGSKKRAFLESELHYAIERQQITVHYQPSINLSTGKIVGVEALARWDHPELGMVSPLDFIEIAEQTGLINDIGFCVLETAIRDVRQWQRKYLPDLRLAVNFSSKQLHSPNICHDVVKTLITYDFPPSNLDVEVTESILIRDFKQIMTKLNSLQRLGCRIAMDDFGTGYSSLNYARIIPWNILKIDRSFVSELQNNKVNSVIVKNVISAASELGYEVIAEGVETEAELAILKQYQCDQCQGYLFAKPMPAGAFNKEFFESNFLPNTLAPL